MLKANWIHTAENNGDNCPLFLKKFSVKKNISSAVLKITARGVYEAHINGSRVGEFLLAPGFTSYRHRIQLQEYEVTHLLKEENFLVIQLAGGWYKGKIANWWSVSDNICAVIAELTISYTDGTEDVYYTDNDWLAAKSGLEFCEIYDGFRFDARIVPEFNQKTVIAKNNSKAMLIPQEGEFITEQERIKPIAVIKTPKGETVLDFGQNLVGTVEFTVAAKDGDEVCLSFAEILDKNGDFYNENYRAAKCRYEYICKNGVQGYKPTLTFYGFRYVRIDKFPTEIKPENFTAVVVHSDIKRKGYIETSNQMLNQLFHNIIWGQKSNFLDIPTDCPQRDERMGWLGDAQVFVRTASYNFEVEKFFIKWFGDMVADQWDNGAVPKVIPFEKNPGPASAAWGDAIAICPWQIYLTYGNKEILKSMFVPIKKWVNYITATTTKPNLWFGGEHFGDWLELKAPYGAYKGATRDDLIASAFYARSTELLCKIADVLGEDAAEYKELYEKIRNAYIAEFKEDYKTQTEYALTLYFNLSNNPEQVARGLADMILADGKKLQTGFVGTPYLLHALSKYGYSELAYDLLLRVEYPSWLYPITKGATTMWEHWDGIMPDGRIWPADMNSFNHYAYGAVADWIYGVCAGINTVESAPGFERVLFTPVATDKIDWLKAEINTKYGAIKSEWRHENGKLVYEITTPVDATAEIGGKSYSLTPGNYIFKSKHH